jgi:hypothetical protein
VVEYDAASLRTALAEVFSEVEVFSGWGAKLEAWWRSNRPFAAVAKIQRLFIRIPAYFGWNLFVGTTPPSNGGPLLFGTGRKPVR